MKHFVLFCFFFLLCLYTAEAQTYADLPGPENVLVVYKAPVVNDSLSYKVMEYYKTVRGIPAGNIVLLDGLVSEDITIDGSTHKVIIAQNGDIIQDSINATFMYLPTRHAWKYYLDRIASPIKQHIINNNLLNKIRYIVLCKGVPFKVQAAADWSGSPGNLTVESIACEEIENFT